MRFHLSILLGLGLFSAQGQPIGLSNLLSLTNCKDTVCMGAFADSAGFCKRMGNEEDGWLWFSCEHINHDSITDNVHLRVLGYFGYTSSYYRFYSLGTRDTAFAAMLTEELGRIGFTVDKPHPQGQHYRSSAYPGLEIQRLEKRATNIGRDGIRRKELVWVFKVVVTQR